MFIHTEETPNPNTLKFLPGKDVTGGAAVEFTSKDNVKGQSPLADRLFDVEGVSNVFLGSDFVSVSKESAADWGDVKTLVLGVLFEHFSMGHPVLIQTSPVGAKKLEYVGNDKETVDKIIELLDARVRPAVARDGGDIEFCDFDKGILYLRMRGACAGCPSSTMTLKMGIENMMRHYVPEVLEVRAAE